MVKQPAQLASIIFLTPLNCLSLDIAFDRTCRKQTEITIES